MIELPRTAIETTLKGEGVFHYAEAMPYTLIKTITEKSFSYQVEFSKEIEEKYEPKEIENIKKAIVKECNKTGVFNPTKE